MTTEPNDIKSEFAIVRQLLNSSSKSRGIDAFCLALLKVERQARRLFTYLAFQSDCFSNSDITDMRQKLAAHRNFGFASALAGFDLLSPISMENLIGQRHKSLMVELTQIKNVRNKLFHGQVTTEGRSRTELENFADSLIEWATTLSASAQLRLGYDGFTLASSYTKHMDLQFSLTLKRKLTGIGDYCDLIENAHKCGNDLLSVKNRHSD